MILSNKIKNFIRTTLLYCSMSSNLTADEIIKIDSLHMNNKYLFKYF